MESDRDRLDKWLDASLKAYGNVEPRTGLETRLLASLAAKENSAAARLVIARRWLWLIAAVATATCILAAFWVARIDRPIRQAPDKTAVMQPSSPPMTTVSPNHEPQQISSAMHRPRNRHAKVHEPANVTQVAKAPRLEQFPSPRPLSEQEQLLVRYVERNPKEAVLIAREQEKYQQEIQQWMQQSSSSDESSSSTER